MRHHYHLQHGRIILRPLEERDIEELRVLRNKNLEFFFDSVEITSEAQRAWYERYLQKEDDVMFAVERSDKPGEFIGAIAIYNINPQTGIAECGRTVLDKEKAPLKGIGTETTAAACHVAFSQMGVKKIVAEGGFMSFAGVDTGDDVTAQPVEKEVKVADSSSKDKKTERPAAEKTDKKEDAPSTKNEDKSPVDNKKTQPEEKVENKTDQETVEQDTKPEQSVEKTENAKEDTSADTVENADSVSAEGENIASEKPQQNKNIKEQVFAAEQMIPLENLSAMNAVTVYNAVDGTYSVMTGAELVAQIENYGTEIGAFMSQNGQSDITLVNLQQPQANQQVALYRLCVNSDLSPDLNLK